MSVSNSDSALTEVPWLVTPEKVQEAVKRVIAAAGPCAVYLFGSYVRGTITRDSDLDLLAVVDDSIENCRKESARLRKVLSDVFMPVDILVIRQSDFDQLKDMPGLIYNECFTKGQKVYERS